MLQEVQGRQALQGLPEAQGLSVAISMANLIRLSAPLLLVTTIVAAAADVGEPEWPDDDDLEARIAAVNDGELAFVSADAAAGAHAHLNRVRITEDSLASGWVALEQCHENLDAVPSAQIMFRAGGIRDLTIDDSRNIARAWVEGHSVQLRDVGHDALLCIHAGSQALYSLGDGLYRLRNGPYMRRFLDGYYPMQLALAIDWPAERLRLVGQSPPSQPGFAVTDTATGINVTATFEGRLITCFDFCDRGVGDCADLAPPCGAE